MSSEYTGRERLALTLEIGHQLGIASNHISPYLLAIRKLLDLVPSHAKLLKRL